ncbi:hypothetical protein BCR44DRAFT_47967 [Catenaria anguillulae PL171]|uniref:Uncharacterized protein n=1 Tax=Catenaria anguillulae PL171 TaxID=765915 RepID=A0A1Y2HBZ5_9FUNG|nr:hypothetical protein BCR44DRAFT_47967 [Catenaria anguillulae PL171]
MYRTQVGYRLACLVWKEDKVDRFVEKSRFTGKMVFGGATVIGLGYISYKSFRAVVWVVDKVSGRKRGSVLEPKREIED